MRLVRICISVTGLAIGSLVLNPSLAGAVSPCAPGQPTGRPPGQPPNAPPGQPAGRPPQYPIGKCQLQLSAAAAAPRSSVTAGGSGFAARSSVAMSIGSTPVGTATADGEGRFTQSFVVPADMAPGQTDVRATGLGSDGTPFEQTADFEVLAPQGSPAVAGTPGLRPGAGLAAAPQGGFGLIGAPLVGGGLAALPGNRGGTGSSAGIGASTGLGTGGNSASSASELALPGSTADPALSVTGAGAASPRNLSAGATGTPLDRLNPLVAVGGGLALAAVGAGAVVALKKRRPGTD